ncbi:hypothetical protein LINPERPRIM_LOCUS41708, partial [Linum perenne]
MNNRSSSSTDSSSSSLPNLSASKLKKPSPVEYDPIVDSYTPSSAAPAPAPGQAASLAPSLAPGVSQSADSPQGSAVPVPVPETPSEGSTPNTPAALNPPSTS